MSISTGILVFDVCEEHLSLLFHVVDSNIIVTLYLSINSIYMCK